MDKVVYLNTVSGKRNLLNQEGGVSFKTLVWVVVIFLALYSAYQFVHPTFSYYMMRTDVEDEAKLAHMYSDRTILNRILKKAEVWNVPLTEENVEIKRGLRNIVITVTYTDRLKFFGRWKKDLNRRIEVNMPLKEHSGVLH